MSAADLHAGRRTSRSLPTSRAIAAKAAVAAAVARSLPRWCLAPPRAAPPAFLLERSVVVAQEPPPGPFPVDHQQDEDEWAAVECAARNAYGCGEHGQRLVQGLTLHACLVAAAHPAAGDLTSALYIQASDAALRTIQAEFCWVAAAGDPILRIDENDGLGATAFVVGADERFVFLALHLHLRKHGARQYYLVYDAVSSSLSMAPFLPENYPVNVEFTVTPLHAPRGGVGGGRRYDLVLLARKLVPPTPERVECRHEDVLCVWTPAAAENEPDPDPDPDSVRPWRLLRRFGASRRRRSNTPSPRTSYSHSPATCSGRTSRRASLTAPGRPPAAAAVEFGFIPIPPGCPPDERWAKLPFNLFFPMTRDRTMRPVAGGIRFVCIDRSRSLGGVTVTVWSLDMETRRWTERGRFRVRELWRLWSFRRRGLPETEPRFPALMEDGTLCLLLRGKPRSWDDVSLEEFVCNVDLESMTVLWSGRLRQCHGCDDCEHAAILPLDFFGKQLRACGALAFHGSGSSGASSSRRNDWLTDRRGSHVFV